MVKRETDSNPADPPFVFRPGCGGKREQSKEARELRERLANEWHPHSSKGKHSSKGSRPRAGGRHSMHSSSGAAATAGDHRSAAAADTASQELTEKGSKRLMESDDGREELRQGTFDLDRTTERVIEEGKKDASPEARAAADKEEVKESVKSRVVSYSQTS